MSNIRTTNVDRIIAKIDNDFNPDNSDWIPRVGAWVHDALGLVQALKTKRVKNKYVVKNRIIYNKCGFKGYFKMYDKCGVEIKEYDGVSEKGCCGMDVPSTGETPQETIVNSSGTVTTIYNKNSVVAAEKVITQQINGGDGSRYNVIELYRDNIDSCDNRGYIIIDCRQIELTFDTDYVIIEEDVVRTCHSDVYNCDFDEIPDNAKLIEFVAYYCMYKMLLRGYKHPVMNLAASQYGTNPYYIYKSMQNEVERSIINDGIDQDLTRLWRSKFFIEMFDPRN